MLPAITPRVLAQFFAGMEGGSVFGPGAARPVARQQQGCGARAA